jgi:hypothetical protein
MSRFCIQITEIEYNPVKEEDDEVLRYQQTVDVIDLGAIITAVNSAQPHRVRALRSDAGKPKPKKEVA